jgi:exosortase E/protease (VPEID-CTERM system)
VTLTRSRLSAAGLLFCLELAALAFAYQVLASLDCRVTGAGGLCLFLGSLIARAVAVAATFLLILWARPAATRALLRRIEADPFRQGWLGLHLAGVAMLFLPLAAADGDWRSGFATALVPWLAGGAAAAAGALLWLAPASAWAGWVRDVGRLPLAALVVAFLLPDLAAAAQPLWDLSAPSRATFEAVRAVLDLAGASPVADASARVLGVSGFHVEIARACSGIEGIALVLGFSTLYALLFRAQLRTGRFWLTAVPLGLAASWLLNVLRIAALVAIGAYASPEFALNGFHSYAGWMLFTLLAVALLYGAHAIRWLQRAGVRPAPQPLRSDWSAACILPFIALMAADVVLAAVFPQPALGYPLRILAAVAVLAAFRPAYRRLLPWSPDAAALGAGVVVGALWLLARAEAGPADLAVASAAAGLGGLWFLGWAAARVAGTVLVVPLVEELFFRGYLLARLDAGGPARRLLALAVSSALFAAMHDRWLIAFLAGVIFALVYLRRGRLADAIAAHVAANLVVAAWAAATGDWSAL